MKSPTLRSDGSCPACSGGWTCSFHIAEGLRKDKENAATLRRVCESAKVNELARICARFELESDEMQTREEKALQLQTA